MSHRVYLYNISHPGEAKKKDVMMVEWGYELPLLLTPLLVSFNQFAGNNYNNHVEENDTGLYYDTALGIQSFRAFYAFVENHKDELIDDFDAFLIAKEKLFTFLNKLKQPFFNLDAWDVFNMSDVSHERQAEKLAQDIKQNNAVFEKAIVANDVSLLDFSEFSRDATLGFSSFKELLNYPDFDYGWGHIYQEYEEQPDVEIYEENGLWGLKSADAKILIAPYFDEFYGFEYSTNAVVKKQDKFGYVNKDGKIVIPLIYDDAYDFEGDFAIVAIGEKFGLIGLNGEVKLLATFDNLNPIGPPGTFYCAKLKDKFGVIDADGTIVLPFDFDNEIKGESWDRTYSVKENNTGKTVVYSHSFKILGNFHPDFVDAKEMEMGKVIVYEVKKHKHASANQLLSANGEVILSGYEKIIEYYNNSWLIRKDKKIGFYTYDCQSLLDFEYDKIEDLCVSFDVPWTDFFKHLGEENMYEPYSVLKLTKGDKFGLFFKAKDFNLLTIPLIYDNVKHIKSEFFELVKNQKSAVYNFKGIAITDFEYDEIIKLISYSGIAYGIKNGNVYTITRENIFLADKTHLQEYVDSNGGYGYYYFDDKTQRKIQAYIDRN
ncbi:MAG: WG repeat-containing protein [Pedobacter sp.]|nr:MAG: WG repeat-containing protein [Pedobacter sp.]